MREYNLRGLQQSAKERNPRQSKDFPVCPDCGQPTLPRGIKKRPNEYDHASGCPRTPKKKKGKSDEREA